MGKIRYEWDASIKWNKIFSVFFIPFYISFEDSAQVCRHKKHDGRCQNNCDFFVKKLILGYSYTLFTPIGFFCVTVNVGMEE